MITTRFMANPLVRGNLQPEQDLQVACWRLRTVVMIIRCYLEMSYATFDGDRNVLGRVDVSTGTRAHGDYMCPFDISPAAGGCPGYRVSKCASLTFVSQSPPMRIRKPSRSPKR